jgi:hypothetical protein
MSTKAPPPKIDDQKESKTKLLKQVADDVEKQKKDLFDERQARDLALTNIKTGIKTALEKVQGSVHVKRLRPYFHREFH